MNVRNFVRSMIIVGALFTSQIVVAQAPAGAPAGATGLCKDGTYYTGASKQGACRGHQGVKEWYGDSGGSSKATAGSSEKSTAATPSNASSASTTSSKASAAAQAPAGATGLCKDGTYYTGASKQGACRGHQGVKEWYGDSGGGSKAAAAPAATQPATPSARATAPTTAASGSPPPPAPAASSKATTTTPAPGGGADKVWLNTASNVYHCAGSRYYGKTKTGAYMTEAEAKAKGAHPDHGQPCK